MYNIALQFREHVVQGIWHWTQDQKAWGSIPTSGHA